MRLFIAIELSPEIKSELNRLQSALREFSGEAVKYPRIENLHLTLKFLGETSRKKFADVKDVLKEVASLFSKYEISLSKTGCFPGGQNVRVIWAGINDLSGSTTGIANLLESEFEVQGLGSEDREFHPHITLGRVRNKRRSKRTDTLPQTFSGSVSALEVKSITQKVESLCLIQSSLNAEGPEYTVLVRENLL